MAEKEVWIGSAGPFLYEDTDAYPDSSLFSGVKAARILVDAAPTSLKEAANKEYVDATAEALMTVHEAATDPHPQYQRESEKGNANGYCPLDASVLVPLVNIPSNLVGKSADLWDGYEFSDYLDQAVKQASTPTFAGLTLTAFSGFVKATAGVLSAAALVDGDIPDTITLTNITQITNRSHTSLSDIGTLTHAVIDGYLDQSVKQAALPVFAGLTLTAFSGFLKATAGVISAAALVDGDIPDTITLTNITQITNRSHTSLSDIGSLTHATLDSYLDQAVKQASTPVFAGLTVGTNIGVGAIPATAGVLRLPTTNSIQYRNAANSVDLNLLSWSSGNIVQIGDANTGAINFVNAGSGNNYSFTGGSVIIGGTTPQAGYELTVNNDIYAVGDVSALTFTDRTPAYIGQDPIAELVGIKSIDGKIDHGKLPEFMKSYQDGVLAGRNLGNSVSLLVAGFQELVKRIEFLETKK